MANLNIHRNLSIFSSLVQTFRIHHQLVILQEFEEMDLLSEEVRVRKSTFKAQLHPFASTRWLNWYTVFTMKKLFNSYEIHMSSFVYFVFMKVLTLHTYYLNIIKKNKTTKQTNILHFITCRFYLISPSATPFHRGHHAHLQPPQFCRMCL